VVQSRPLPDALPIAVAAVLVPATVLIAQDQATADPAQHEERIEPNPSGEEAEPTAADRAAAPRDPLEIYADLNLFGEIFDRTRRSAEHASELQPREE